MVNYGASRKAGGGRGGINLGINYTSLWTSPLSLSFFFFCSRTRREIVFILASFFSPLSLILSYLFFFFFYVVAQTWETLDSSFSSKEWEDREFNDQERI